MDYDPIKRNLGRVFNRHPFMRRMFYFLLDVLLLRSWHIRQQIKIFFKNKKQENAMILDAGSGFGQYVHYMARKRPSWTIKGVDVKHEEIENCREFFSRTNLKNVEFQVADLTKYISPGQYDLILSVDVMEHIQEDVKVFTNIFKSLKKGGMLLISTPSDQGGSDVHSHGEESFIGEHVRDGYSIEEITQKLNQAGFGKIKADYTYGPPGALSWKLSMKYPIVMLSVSKLFFLFLPFYYLLVMPFALFLNYLDLKLKHSRGTGLMVKAWKMN
jgi:2-polyprenyl-3-methyl-5-hydroxy-6-metoxy-1,4-benzoquinol methylase